MLMSDCVIPTIKDSGGSIMEWGCLSSQETGDMIKILEIL